MGRGVGSQSVLTLLSVSQSHRGVVIRKLSFP